MGNLLETMKDAMMWSGVFTLSFLGTLLITGSHPGMSAALLSSHSLISPIDQREYVAKRRGEPKTRTQAWLVLLPFQNAPGPNTHGPDPQAMRPFYERVPPNQGVAHESGIRFDRCLDTDTCLLIVPANETTREREILVGLLDIDVPHLRATCEQEVTLAHTAVELLRQVLSEASQIDVYDHYQVGRKQMARVVADGQDLSQLLVNQGLAYPYGTRRIDWCHG